MNGKAKHRSFLGRGIFISACGLGVIVLLIVFSNLTHIGGSPLAGGWVNSEPGQAYFMNINSGGTGTVDFGASGMNGTSHGTVIVHDDHTIEFDGIVDGPLKYCPSGCPYSLNGTTLNITYTVTTPGLNSTTTTSVVTFTQGSVQDFENDISH